MHGNYGVGNGGNRSSMSVNCLKNNTVVVDDGGASPFGEDAFLTQTLDFPSTIGVMELQIGDHSLERLTQQLN